MKKNNIKKAEHRLYVDEKYNKPYIEVVKLEKGRLAATCKYQYILPNKRDYKLVDGRADRVIMQMKCFKKFREVNELNINEFAYSNGIGYDDFIFYYNKTNNTYFIKLKKDILIENNEDDEIVKYMFYEEKSMLKIKQKCVTRSDLYHEYKEEYDKKQKKRDVNIKRKIRRAINNGRSRLDNIFVSHGIK